MKICGLLLVVSWAVILGMVYLFFFRGNVGPQEDGRTVIEMTAAERSYILAEMRGFLEAVEGIMSAVASDDMDRVAKIAQSQGLAGHALPPASLLRKLPLDFKRLGRPTHRLFDALAEEASTVGTPKTVAAKLSEILQKCTACHASFALRAK